MKNINNNITEIDSISATTISSTTVYVTSISATTYYGDGSLLTNVSGSGGLTQQQIEGLI